MQSPTARSLVVAPCVMAVTLHLAACGGTDAPSAHTEVHDSAGITIVQNHLSADLEDRGFGVDPTPLLSIGVLEGDPDYQFYRVRGMWRLADGRIAVANSGSHQVRLYAGEGTFLHAFGGEGEGPEEFLQMALAGVRGDSLVVYDSRNRRMTFLHPDEGFIRTVPVGDDAGGFPQVQGVLADGSVLFGGGLFFGSGDEMATGLTRENTVYRLLSADGELTSDFGEYPSFEMWMDVSENFISATSIPFARGVIAAAYGTTVYIALTDAYEIKAFDEDGSLRRSIRLDQPLRAVTDDDLEAAFQDALDGSEDDEALRAARRRFDETTIHETLPAFEYLLTDRLGNLWVRESGSPGDEAAVWSVFDAQGAIIGRLTMPPRFRPFDIGEDVVLGRRIDDLDVEYVEMYRLSRPAP